MAEMTIAEALRQALREEMRRDRRALPGWGRILACRAGLGGHLQ
jgi:hypothetical protein